MKISYHHAINLWTEVIAAVELAFLAGGGGQQYSREQWLAERALDGQLYEAAKSFALATGWWPKRCADDSWLLVSENTHRKPIHR